MSADSNNDDCLCFEVHDGIEAISVALYAEHDMVSNELRSHEERSYVFVGSPGVTLAFITPRDELAAGVGMSIRKFFEDFTSDNDHASGLPRSVTFEWSQAGRIVPITGTSYGEWTADAIPERALLAEGGYHCQLTSSATVAMET